MNEFKVRVSALNVLFQATVDVWDARKLRRAWNVRQESLQMFLLSSTLRKRPYYTLQLRYTIHVSAHT
jgi:hypothetical protein